MPASSVAAILAAPSETAAAHFAARLSFETDCADVHDALSNGPVDFVLVDARGPNAYARSHVPGALNIPHREMTADRMAAWPKDRLFVVYCAGPHCNGADHAALRLATLGRPVKLMLGGMTGWADEGFLFASGSEPGSLKIASVA
ncbi:rhodanese-like domain-containing protein [Microvirga zambiensis]|uniref:rhodanese-like domain-containing protein n=1 Tax=Microvirga zambiensis TaxID=1402137 RepID=UPI00191E2FFA|nr:rhodanese-like domain-containing protein [Microvirga zambiensis]